VPPGIPQRSLPITTTRASAPSQGVERLTALGDSVSLLLLDLTMPRLGGAETARQVRGILPNVPIVARSGYGDIEVMERFSGAQMGRAGTEGERPQLICLAGR
jgi:CheY-like chemotaxis protein